MSSPAALRERPDALLLDFGGVVFETRKRPQGRAELVGLLRDVLVGAGHDVSAQVLRHGLDAGLTALKHWKHASSRRREPRELTSREIIHDFVASDLEDGPRAVLTGSAGVVLQAMSTMLSEHAVRPGVPELLEAAAALGARVGIVSNAHSGRAHRALLAQSGLAHLVAVQIYSDEVGIRKPHPGMVELAASALGTEPQRCWYVGDTQDRDVVAGRRAGVGAVVLTRSHHTDVPPFAVSHRADAVLDTPQDLVAILRDSSRTLAGTVRTRTTTATARPVPAGLLLDHGGVIALSCKNPAARRAFVEDLSHRLRSAGHDLDEEQVAAALATGRERYGAWKEAAHDDGRHPEVTPVTFWCDLVAPDWPPGARAYLKAEAHALTLGYARTKSRPRLREGIFDVLQHCRERGIRVAVVSNTICGRAVRESITRFGVDRYVSAYVFSDELGVRKPDGRSVLEAARAIGVAPRDCWFVGDKPWRDTVAARRAGVGTTVLLQGGSGTREQLASSAAEPRDSELHTDHVLDEPRDLVALLSTHVRSTSLPA